MNARAWSLFFTSVLFSGCASLPTTAVVNGVEVPRVTTEFVGHYYAVRHSAAHPQPGGPSSGLKDHGGKISGQICGMDVDYQVTHEGDYVQLSGFLDNKFPTQIQVRDQGGERVISGNLGSSVVDLRLRSNELVGTTGYRHLKMVQVDDSLVGKMRALNTDFLSDVTMTGRNDLWALTAATQGALLPNVLTCFIAKIGAFGRSPLKVGIGGPGGAQPRESSSLYQP